MGEKTGSILVPNWRVYFSFHSGKLKTLHFFSFYLQARAADQWRETRHLLLHSPQHSECNKDETRSLELSLHLPCRWKAPRHISPPASAPRVYISRELKSEMQPDMSIPTKWYLCQTPDPFCPYSVIVTPTFCVNDLRRFLIWKNVPNVKWNSWETSKPFECSLE